MELYNLRKRDHVGVWGKKKKAVHHEKEGSSLLKTADPMLRASLVGGVPCLGTGGLGTFFWPFRLNLDTASAGAGCNASVILCLPASLSLSPPSIPSSDSSRYNRNASRMLLVHHLTIATFF